MAETSASVFTRGLTGALIAGAPLALCDTTEDNRVRSLATKVALEANARLYVWSEVLGLEEVRDGRKTVVSQDRTLRAVLERLLTRPRELEGAEPILLILFDAFGPVNLPPDCVRLLKECFFEFASTNGATRRTLLLTGTAYDVPTALHGYLHFVDLPLPTRSEIAARLASRPLAKRMNVDELATRAVGLSELVLFSLAREIDAFDMNEADAFAFVTRRKRDEVRRAGILDVIEAPRVELGGFGRFKAWFRKRKPFLTRDSTRQVSPRGVLLLGFPGCGKSHAARYIAQELGIPLVAMDVGRIQDKWVGSSEARLRSALRTLEVAAPVVLFIDEIEKALAGAGTESTGITTRLVGNLLTWLADNREPIFVIATCNSPDLPPELTRAGRFDASFVVELPTAAERRQIAIALCDELDIRLGDDAMETLVKLTGPDRLGFSGAEIRQLLVEALYEAGADATDILPGHLKAVRGFVSPLSSRPDGKAKLALYAPERLPGYQRAGDA